jgi:hypothetical protein
MMAADPEDLDVAQDDAEAGGGETAPSALPLPTTAAQPITRAMSRLPGYQPRAAEPDPNAQPFFLGGGAPAQQQSKSAFKDFARQVWASTLDIGQGLLGAASMAERGLTSNPDIVAHIEQVRRAAGDVAAENLHAMSPAAQKAYHSSLFGSELFGGQADESGHVPTPGDVGWGNYIGATLASVIPSAVLAVLPGGIVGRAAVKIGEALGATAARSTAASTVAQLGTTGALFGADQAGSAYEALVGQIDKAKPDELMQSPVYAEARKQGMDDVNARRQLVSTIAPTMGALQFAVGAAAGAGAGQLLTRGAVGAAGQSLTRRVGIGAAEGAATMGGQSGAGNAFEQSASMQAGLQKEFDPSQAAVALLGGAGGGALFGAVGGALHRGAVASPPGASPTVEGDVIPPDHRAALTEALQITGPKQPPLLTFQPDRTQGDGFSLSPDSTFAPPTQPQLTGPDTRAPRLTFNPDRTQGEGVPWTNTGEGMIPGQGGFTVDRQTVDQGARSTVPELPGDIKAQVKALGDPENPKDAVYVPKGTPMPRRIPDGVTRVMRPEGTLLTNNPAKAALFRRTDAVNDTVLAHILSYPETKDQAAASSAPRVIQGKDADGNVVYEAAVSPQGEDAARTVAAAQVLPHGSVEATTPEDAVARRLPAPVEPPTEPPIKPILATAPQAETNPNIGAQLRKRGAVPQPVERAQAYVSPETGASSAPALKTTPEKAPRSSSMAREAAAESRDQPVAYESGGKKTATVVEDAGVEKPRSAQTTNKTRILGDLESKVSNGLMTAAEADRAYGRKERGMAAGRQRTFPDFASYIRDRLQRASDPDVERELLARAEKIQNDKSLTTSQKLAQSREVNRTLQSVGPEHAEKLRGMLNELEGNARPKLQGLGNNRVDTFYDQRINKPAQDILDADHANGGSWTSLGPGGSSVHRYLDAIANDPVIKVRLPHAAVLAKMLRERLPEDLQVKSFGQFGAPDGKLGMYYYKQPGLDKPYIALNPDHNGHSLVETVLHESWHAVTTDYIKDLKPGSRDHKILSWMAKELHDNIGQRDYLTDSERAHLAYAMSDPYELHTMLMTSPVIQRLAAEVRPSPEFLQGMRGLGYDLKPSTSIWQAFTQWVRKVIGLPAGSSSLLDHILRPLQDIADRATKFNRDGLPQDPQLRAVAEPTLDAATHALPRFGRDDVSRVIKRIDPAGLGDRARQVLLGWVPNDHMLEWNRKLFQSRDPKAPGNSFEDYRTAYEAEAARSKKFSDQYADRASAMISELTDPVAQLLNDATLAEVHLGTSDPNANAHLTTREQQQALSDVQARYDAFSDGDKKTYNKFRDYYKETDAEERVAQFKSMVKTALPDATSAQVRTLAQSLRTMRGIKDFIDNPDVSPIAAAFADKWDRSRALVGMVTKLHAQGFVRGDYFPLRRFGDYVVRYGTKGHDDYGVERFERRGEAEERRAELVRQGAEPSNVMLARDTAPRNMVPAGVMDDLNRALSKAGDLSEDQLDTVRDAFASIMLQNASHSAAVRARRQGVQGASTNHAKVLAQDFLSLSSRIGYLEHGPDRAQALAAMGRHTDWLERNGEAGEGIRARSVLNEIKNRQPLGDDGSSRLTGKIASKFSRMGFAYSLMSFSHMLTSTVEAHSNSIPMMGARHGLRANLALAKALKDITPAMAANAFGKTAKAIPFLGPGLKAADWNLSNVIRNRLIAAGADRGAVTDLFDGRGGLNAAGLIDHTMTREMRRIANPGANVTRGWWDRFMDLNAIGAHTVDAINKSAIAKAAYDLELRKTGNHEQAKLYAVDMARKAMPNYNLGNKSRQSTNRGFLGEAAAPLMQFKQYGINMYSVMANLVQASIHNAPGPERTEARKAFAGILATHAMMAGVFALPFVGDPLRYVGGLYDLITRTKPHDYENDVRRWIADAFGPELGEIVSRGLPHIAGIDIHRRVGLSNLLEVPELKSFDKKGFAELVAAAMTGAAGDDATAIAGGMMKVVQGDVMAGVKAMVPRVVRDPMKAAGLATSGVTDSKGKTILPASKLSGGDVAAQALGFQPARVSEFREGRNAVLEAREEATVARTRALNAFTTASPSGRTSALKEVQDYNRGNPQAPITYAQLMSALKRQAQTTQNPGAFGLSLPKKSAHTLSKQGSFANVQ